MFQSPVFRFIFKLFKFKRYMRDSCTFPVVIAWVPMKCSTMHFTLRTLIFVYYKRICANKSSVWFERKMQLIIVVVQDNIAAMHRLNFKTAESFQHLLTCILKIYETIEFFYCQILTIYINGKNVFPSESWLH